MCRLLTSPCKGEVSERIEPGVGLLRAAIDPHPNPPPFRGREYTEYVSGQAPGLRQATLMRGAIVKGNLMVRRTILRVGICAGLSLAGAMPVMVSAASAQDKWPSRRVTIVVPFAAGSNTDACARLLADLLRDIYGQPFIVENRGGAGGTLGANAVAKAAPDGYTLLMAGNTSLSAAPALFKAVPYDPIKDFTAIARVGRFSSVLVTTPRQPFRTMQEFVTYAKANPGTLSYGHGNSTGHIVGEAIKKRTGLEMTRVPYTATPAAITDLIGGRTQLVPSDLLSGIPQIQAGRVVPLATIFRERSTLLAEVPTLHETVMPGFEVLPWLGLFGPANMPADIVRMLSDNLRTIFARPENVARIGTMGIEPFYAPSEETAAFIRADLPKWQEMAREAGIEPQ
jgi:tripartite-type tricarboxylate transporter receptor subunit TctC